MPNFTLTTVEGSGSDNIRIGQVVEMAQGPILLNSQDGLQSYLREGTYVEAGYATELEQFSGVPTATGGSNIEGLGVRGYLVKLSNGDELFIQNAAVSYLSVGGTGPWVQRPNSSVTGLAAPLEQYDCSQAVVTTSGVLYAILGNKAYSSVDLGLNWSAVAIPKTPNYITSIVVANDGAVLFSGYASGDDNPALLSRLSSSGVFSEAAGYGASGTGYVYALLKTSNGHLYVYNNSTGIKGIYRSTDHGVTWGIVDSQETGAYGATNGTEIIYTTNTPGSLRYMNSSGVWSTITPSGFPSVGAAYVSYANGRFYAGTSGYKSKLYTATTVNGTWTQISLPAGKLYGSLIPAGGTSTKVVYTSATSKPLVTSDGSSVTFIDTVGKSFCNLYVTVGSSSLILVVDTVGTTDNIVTSTDGGVTWILRSTGFVVSKGIYYAGDNIFIAVHGSSSTGLIYTSYDGGVTWVSGSRYNMEASYITPGGVGTNIFAASPGGSFLVCSTSATTNSGINTSEDRGVTWGAKSLSKSLTNKTVTFFKGANKFVFGSSGETSTHFLFSMSMDFSSETNIPIPSAMAIRCVASSEEYLVAASNNRIYIFDKNFSLVKSLVSPSLIFNQSNVLIKHVADDVWVYSNGYNLGITYNNFDSAITLETSLGTSNSALGFFGTYSGNYAAAGVKNRGKAYGIPKRTTGTTKYLRIK